MKSIYTSHESAIKDDLYTLHKVIKLVHLNTSLEVERDSITGAYKPLLKRGDIVQCDLIGIGSELDDIHYCIVWNSVSNNESITVIPTTSKELYENIDRFGIGKIEGCLTSKDSLVPKDTYVYLNKIREVSRKNVKPWDKKDATGEKLKDSRGRNIICSLNEIQIKRIKDAISVNFLDENFLVRTIFNEIKTGVQLPINYNKKILNIGYIPLKSYSIDKTLKNNFVLKYEFNDGFTGSIEFLSLRIPEEIVNHDKYKILFPKIENFNAFKIRDKLINLIFSKNKDQVDAAEEVLDYIKQQNIIENIVLNDHNLNQLCPSTFDEYTLENSTELVKFCKLTGIDSITSKLKFKFKDDINREIYFKKISIDEKVLSLPEIKLIYTETEINDSDFIKKLIKALFSNDKHKIEIAKKIISNIIN